MSKFVRPNGDLRIDGVWMSPGAAECVEMTGADVAADVADLRAGRTTREALLEHCLDGAAPEHESDWRDYVLAVAYAAEHQS